MQVAHSTVNAIFSIERDQLVITDELSMAVFVSLKQGDVTHMPVSFFILILKVLVMESLIWVDVYVFINSIFGKDIVMEITFIVNMTFGPALFS
jgi:hypothetical protein